MRNAFISFVREHRSNTIAHTIARVCDKYLRAYWNENNWNMRSNGEGRVLEVFSRHCGLTPTILDVGSHRGEWCLQAINAIPKANIFAFEIIPEIRRELIAAVAGTVISPVLAGLSSRNGEIQVTFNKTHPSTNSVVPNSDSPFFSTSEIETIVCKVITGDDFCTDMGVTKIDFLKIDTEGHEFEVLRGFEKSLHTLRAPRVIQFEYGGTSRNARVMLSDIYELLEPFGYSVGRIFPRNVAFKSYHGSDEHFRMGNYLAVKRDDALLDTLR